MKIKQNLRKIAELGIGITIIGALVLAGCGGKAATTSANTTGTSGGSTGLTITPMKGQFSSGTSVRVMRTTDSVIVASGVVGTNGSTTVQVPNTETGPFLIEAGQAGDTYFDESTGNTVAVPVGTVALRALIPSATASSSVGVTALTEFAVGQIVAASGIAAATPNTVLAANAAVGSQFGVTDPLVPPSVIAAGTRVAGGSNADNYALKLAGLAKMAATGVSPLKALRDMRDDMADGKLDGRIGTTPITSFAFTIPASGVTPAQMSAQMVSQVQAATAQYAAAGTTAPTITLTVQDMAALLQAAIRVGQAASPTSTTLSADKRDAQIANTIQAQVATIATAVAGGSSVAAATTTAVTNAGSTATILANLGTAATDFLNNGIKAGWYSMAGLTPTGSPRVHKSIGSGTGSALSITNTMYVGDMMAKTWGALSAASAAANSGWTLTATSPGGWVQGGNTGTFNISLLINADNTITYTDSKTGESATFLPQVVSLAGLPLRTCAINPGLTCTAADVYPAGAKDYVLANKVRNVDTYNAWTGAGATSITGGNGVALTALPALGTDFCWNDDVFAAIPGAATGADNYNVIHTGIAGVPGCTQAKIAAAKSNTSGPGGTVWTNGSVLVVYQATGNASAPSVLVIKRVNDNPTSPGLAVWMTNKLFAPVNGAVYDGNFQAAGPVPQCSGCGNNGNLNAAAANADAAKNGLPALP